MEHIKPYVLPFFGVLGWLVASGLAFFAIEGDDRMTAFHIIGEVVLALFAIVSILSPFIQVYQDRKKHAEAISALTFKHAEAISALTFKHAEAISALTFKKPDGFISCYLGSIKDFGDLMLNIKNHSLTHDVKICDVSVSPDRNEGLNYQRTTLCPLILLRAHKDVPGSIQVAFIETSGQAINPYRVNVSIHVEQDNVPSTVKFQFDIPFREMERRRANGQPPSKT